MSETVRRVLEDLLAAIQAGNMSALVGATAEARRLLEGADGD